MITLILMTAIKNNDGLKQTRLMVILQIGCRVPFLKAFATGSAQTEA